jgi:hypothetical protein
VGGFDAEQLTVLFNDVDFCLKLQQQGLLNVFTPYVTMVHHHAKSIGKLTYDLPLPGGGRARTARAGRGAQTLAATLAHDPAYNRHLPCVPRTWLLSRLRE